MSLSAREVAQLRKIISIAEKLLAKAESSPAKLGKPARSAKQAIKRTRRTGKELVAFRKMLKAERKKGVSVAELSKQHGVSTTYLYQLG